MKKIILFFLLSETLSFGLFGQVLPTTSSNIPTRDREILEKKISEDTRKQLDSLDKLVSEKSSKKTFTLKDSQKILFQDLYRNSYPHELKLLLPDENQRIKYAKFLNKKNTGLIKLIPDIGCDELSAKPKIPALCNKFSMPGGGSAYSFRRKDYQIWKLADLLYDGKSLFAFGEMSLGFLVNLGKLEIDQVNNNSKGADFVFSFIPKNDLSGSAEQNTQFVDGLKIGDFLYNKYLPVIVGETYLMRSIAFNGKVVREGYGVQYNELDFDNRKDVIVVFKVVEQETDGTLTILWKLLRSQKSPELNS